MPIRNVETRIEGWTVEYVKTLPTGLIKMLKVEVAETTNKLKGRPEIPEGHPDFVIGRLGRFRTTDRKRTCELNHGDGLVDQCRSGGVLGRTRGVRSGPTGNGTNCLGPICIPRIKTRITRSRTLEISVTKPGHNVYRIISIGGKYAYSNSLFGPSHYSGVRLR